MSDTNTGARRKAVTHEHLLKIMKVLPTDYSDFGGKVVRWDDPEKSYPDCSCGCHWAAWLEHPFGADWCVCTKPGAPRQGLLTFEHQTGEGCFQPERHSRGTMNSKSQRNTDRPRYGHQTPHLPTALCRGR